MKLLKSESVLKAIAKNEDDIKIARERGDRAGLLTGVFIGRILRDNYTRALFEDVAPMVVEAFRQYAGKAYGPRTEQKLSRLMVEATGCAARVVRNTNISILVTNEYTRMTLFKRRADPGDDFRFLDASNRIIPFTIDSLALGDNPEWVAVDENRKAEIRRNVEKCLWLCSEFSEALKMLGDITSGHADEHDIVTGTRLDF